MRVDVGEEDVKPPAAAAVLHLLGGDAVRGQPTDLLDRLAPGGLLRRLAVPDRAAGNSPGGWFVHRSRPQRQQVARLAVG